MSAKHTPGPWTWLMGRIERGPVGKGKTIHAELSAPRPNCPRPYSTGVLTPNWCTDAEGQVWQAWISVKEEDALLIAAAPELLEFAEEVRRTGDTRLASMAIAIIAKATGETK